MSPTYRAVLKCCRLLHVYLTLLGLALILLFAVTGFMLNHENWFGLGEPHLWSTTGALETSLLTPIDRLGIVESLRKDHGAVGAVTAFRENEETLEVEFLRPGMHIVTEIQRKDGTFESKFEGHGWIGVLTDLHKGKSSGFAWSVLIDAVCILMVVISITGLVLWWSLKSRGKWGAMCLLLGVVASMAIYYVWVP